MLLNLVSNAVKFTPEDGRIEVNAELIGQVLRVEVIDTGAGIKQQDQSKLFKMFGCIKDEAKKINTKGIGLGLVISQMITAKFAGAIEFTSEFGKGSNFNFRFEVEPVADQEQEQALER